MLNMIVNCNLLESIPQNIYNPGNIVQGFVKMKVSSRGSVEQHDQTFDMRKFNWYVEEYVCISLIHDSIYIRYYYRFCVYENKHILILILICCLTSSLL